MQSDVDQDIFLKIMLSLYKSMVKRDYYYYFFFINAKFSFNFTGFVLRDIDHEGFGPRCFLIGHCTDKISENGRFPMSKKNVK